MPQPGAPSRPDEDELHREIRALGRRVARLEERLAMAPETIAAPPEMPHVAVSLSGGADTLPVIGRALLGLAGAYILRALTEARVLPQQTGIFAGIAYAMGWLVWAARIPAAQRVKTALYSLTAALILAPLLWESTVRFRAISTATAASVLLVFTVLGLAISWRKNLLIVATIATLTGILPAAALLLATHDVVPFLFVLLAIAAAVEVSACLDHWLSERWLAAAAADLAVLLATYLVTNARGLPEVYQPIPHPALLAAQVGLVVVYLASTMVRTLFRGFTVTTFETVQLGAALALSMGGAWRLTGHAAPTIGLLSLACGAGCYGVAFGFLRGRGEPRRNFHTYASFGLVLVFAGNELLFAASTEAKVLLALGLLCLGAGAEVLRRHGVVYVLIGLYLSGALRGAAELLLGNGSAHSLAFSVYWAAAVAVAAYWLSARRQRHGAVVAAITAAGACWLLAAICGTALMAGYHAIFGQSAPHPYCGSLRTITLAGSGVLLAWASWRRNWTELRPLTYGTMCLGAYRLLAVDPGQNGAGALVLSLLCYGTALILLPRWMHPSVTSPR